MSGCSCEANVPFDGMSKTYKNVLWVVIGINFVMFMVEMVASQLSASMALSADALDFFGDSLTYTVTLLAIGHGLRWRAGAAMIKGVSLGIMGLWVLGSTLYQVFVLEVPNEMIMGLIATVAFGANVISALLLLKYRNGDANVRSVWLCSRNDAIGNLAVLMAAGVVYLTQSRWPDLIVAFLMAGLFLHSATLILVQARKEMVQASSDLLVTCSSTGES